MHINGWNRIFIVLASAWIFCIIFLYNKNNISQFDAYKNATYQAGILASNDLKIIYEIQDPTYKEKQVNEICSKNLILNIYYWEYFYPKEEYKNTNKFNTSRLVTEIHLRDIYIPNHLPALKKEQDEIISSNRIKYITYCFLPPIITYSIGLSIVWILAGFRNQTKN